MSLGDDGSRHDAVAPGTRTPPRSTVSGDDGGDHGKRLRSPRWPTLVVRNSGAISMTEDFPSTIRAMRSYGVRLDNGKVVAFGDLVHALERPAVRNDAEPRPKQLDAHVTSFVGGSTERTYKDRDGALKYDQRSFIADMGDPCRRVRRLMGSEYEGGPIKVLIGPVYPIVDLWWVASR
jgi:hypothetical protein